MFLSKSLLSLFCCLFFSLFAHGVTAESSGRPNILLVVADDLAFTDIGSFGGEINTPTLDALSEQGLRFSQFYSAPSCSPTRATLLTGVDYHLAGLGAMQHTQTPEQLGRPGYEGYLNQRVVTLPELLRDAGYHTFMAGKWHLGISESNSPAARGFEQSFALLQGGGGHFDTLGLTADSPALYRENGQLTSLPEDFYSSRFYSDKMIEYIRGRESKRPFFGYLSYTAPHWPLQAPDASIERYKDRYAAGYEPLRLQRVARAKELGIVPEHQSFAQPNYKRPWQSLSPQRRDVEARKMAVYAAMIDDMDLHLGRVLDALKQDGELDNTVIIFMSDNGAEGHDLDYALPQLKKYIATCCDNRLENLGRANSYFSYGHDWAQAGIALFRGFKAQPLEGGIRVPLIVSFPGWPLKGGIYQGLSSVEDIVPTLLALINLEHPAPSYQKRDVYPITGSSLLPLLDGEQSTLVTNRPLARELFGRAAIRVENWKAVKIPPPYGDDQWQLYAIDKDPGESQDLSTVEPETLKRLISFWQDYAASTGLILSNRPSRY
ncbi:arylsulfatase [Dasania marina]|uniref:arylsulfatase n=1 Tax=Dasania marina TaxID=471499 RepID=UPI000376693D|nr:arylsulfatase [Dasania marina]